jgi:predicted Zn finger-like uncharacterized protein
MKITCETCGAKYTVSDEKVQGKTVKIKCRKCSSTILVNSSGVVSGGSAASADTGSSGAEAGTYLVNVTEGDQRSMTLDELVTAYHSGVVNGETYVWSDGMSDWSALQDVAAIVSALHGAGGGGGGGDEAAAADPTPAPAPMAAAAAGGAGLAMAAEAPRAARREASRADLFSPEPKPLANDRATGSPLFGSSSLGSGASAGGAPGAREENSVLFSLSALTAKAAPAAPAPKTSAASREDSGLIDLKALAASAAPTKSAAAPVDSLSLGDDPSMFPLGAPVLAPPPVVAPVAAADAPQKKGSGIFVMIGGIAIAAAAVAITFMVVKGGDKEKDKESNANASTTAAAQATQSAEPTASATASAAAESPTASPSSSAVAAADPSTSPSATAKAPLKGPIKPGPAGTTKPAATSTGGGEKPAAAPKPASGGCNCPPGDLMCAMNCSAKKK